MWALSGRKPCDPKGPHNPGQRPFHGSTSSGVFGPRIFVFLLSPPERGGLHFHFQEAYVFPYC